MKRSVKVVAWGLGVVGALCAVWLLFPGGAPRRPSPVQAPSRAAHALDRNVTKPAPAAGVAPPPPTDDTPHEPASAALADDFLTPAQLVLAKDVFARRDEVMERCNPDWEHSFRRWLDSLHPDGPAGNLNGGQLNLQRLDDPNFSIEKTFVFDEEQARACATWLRSVPCGTIASADPEQFCRLVHGAGADGSACNSDVECDVGFVCTAGDSVLDVPRAFLVAAWDTLRQRQVRKGHCAVGEPKGASCLEGGNQRGYGGSIDGDTVSCAQGLWCQNGVCQDPTEVKLPEEGEACGQRCAGTNRCVSGRCRARLPVAYLGEGEACSTYEPEPASVDAEHPVRKCDLGRGLVCKKRDDGGARCESIRKTSGAGYREACNRVDGPPCLMPFSCVPDEDGGVDGICR